MLVSLGMTKAQSTAVWLAGPLSGLLCQPVIGVLSDASTSRYGRRRPFIVGGTMFVVLALILVGYAKDVSHLFWGDSRLAFMIAAFGFYLLDFSINAVQACLRALIADTVPGEEQATANAWAGRMSAVGSVLGYTIGFLDLESYTGLDSMKTFSLISAFFLVFSVGITCFSISESSCTTR